MGVIRNPSHTPALKSAVSPDPARGPAPRPTTLQRPPPRSEPSSPKWFLDASLVLQMDAIVFSFFRRRIEYDASAASVATAYTTSVGALHSPLSTVFSIFSGSCTQMQALVRRAQAERASGVFICRAAPDDGPRDVDGATGYERLSLSGMVIASKVNFVSLRLSDFDRRGSATLNETTNALTGISGLKRAPSEGVSSLQEGPLKSK